MTSHMIYYYVTLPRCVHPHVLLFKNNLKYLFQALPSLKVLYSKGNDWNKSVHTHEQRCTSPRSHHRLTTAHPAHSHLHTAVIAAVSLT